MDSISKPPGASGVLNRFFPAVLLLFVGSGCAALIYEIVWFQLLQLVIGSSAVSLGVLLGTFMGGMCLGSLLLPRLVSARHHPLKVYAILEVGIAVIAILILFGMPLVDRMYSAIVGHGLPAVFLRGFISAICLLPPTILMGATLPAVARWVETTPRGISWLGFFYGGNIAGAVFGCLLAGFYLLRAHDVVIATGVGVALNLAVALGGWLIARATTYRPPAAAGESAGAAFAARGAGVIYVAIAISGMCALGSQVIWTRLLSLMLGATVYTFAIILAVFLIGLGIGSSAGAFFARAIRRPRLALGVCQLLAAVSIAWTGYIICGSLPWWPIDPLLAWSPWHTFQLDLLRCAWATLPATILWGASFPLALASVAAPGQDPGRLVGRVYAANTVGAIIGAGGFSLILIGWIGTQHSQMLLIGISAAISLVLFAPVFRAWMHAGGEGVGRMSAAARIAAVIASVALLSAVAARIVPPVPGGLVAYGRSLPARDAEMYIIYKGEGMNASVAVSETYYGARNFHVSGKVVASSEPQDMRLQKMLGHMPALLHPKPRSVLVVGCGAGVTAGTFVLHPDVERIVICEIESLIPPAAAEYFGLENNGVMNDPRVEIVHDDARHYIMTTREKFDIITSDPIHPWVKGAAVLYSKEYFELCKKKLNPGGLITQWVPLYESNLEAVKSEIATFFHVFPEGTIWSNDLDGEGYDIVLLGHAGEFQIDVDAMQGRLDGASHAKVWKSLWDVGFLNVIDILSTYAGRGEDLAPWLQFAEINRERNLRLQYLAGMGVNTHEAARIFDSMLLYRKYPEQLFLVQDGSRSSALREALDPLK